MRIKNKIKIKSKILMTVFLVAVVGVLFNFLPKNSVADSTKNMLGWIWGGADDGAGINSGVGWISLNNSSAGGTVNYGLNIPSADGNLSGSAYSENMGYIAFDNADGLLDGCPDGVCRAYREGNDIKGWARFSDIARNLTNAGGNSGWIRLSGTAQNGSHYGVTIDLSGKKTMGYAWSDEFGYISFNLVINCATMPADLSNHCILLPTGNSCSDQANCDKNITTGTYACKNIDANGCVAQTDCSDPCPAPVTEQCPGCQIEIKRGGWLEVAP